MEGKKLKLGTEEDVDGKLHGLLTVFHFLWKVVK
jgi:hypothetical protein